MQGLVGRLKADDFCLTGDFFTLFWRAAVHWFGPESYDCFMKIVADTNTFLAVALNEPEKSQIIKLTSGHELIAPDVLPFEIGNALTAMMRRHVLDADEITTAWDSVQSIRVELYRTNIRAALEIAVCFNIHAYDAYFLECASSLKLPLLTLDRRLRETALRNKIKIIEVTT